MWFLPLFASPVASLFAGQIALPLGFEGFMNLNALGGSSQHCRAAVLTYYPACSTSKGVLARTPPAAHSVLRLGGSDFYGSLLFLPEGTINTRLTTGTSLSPPVHLASLGNSPLPTQRPAHCLGLLLATNAQELVEKQVDTGVEMPPSTKVLRPVIFYTETHDQYSL